MTSDKPFTITVKEAARRTGLSEDTIYDEIHQLKLPAKRRGRQIIIRFADLEKWYDELEDAAS